MENLDIGASPVLKAYSAMLELPKEKLNDHISSLVKSSPTIRNYVTEDIANTLKKSVNPRAGRRTVVITENLDISDQNRLESTFPEYNIQYSNKRAGGFHLYARAHRKLEYQLLYDRVVHDRVSAPRGRYLLKDVGGSVLWHIGNNSRDTHVCAPVLDANDSNRYSKLKQYLSESVPKKGTFHDRIMKNNTTALCHAKSQHCDVRANALIFVHSVYDMTTTDIAASMSMAGADRGYGTMIWHPDVLLKAKGMIESLGCYFEKYRQNGVKYIRFAFVEDGQYSYTHRFDTYLNIVSGFSAKYNGDCYTINWTDRRSDVLFFEVNKVIAPVVPRCRMGRSYVGDGEYMILYTYDFRTVYQNFTFTGAGRLRPLRLVVPTYMYEKLYAYGLTLQDGKFLLKNIMTAAVALNNRQVVNGTTVTNKQKMPVQDLEVLAASIYHLLYIRQYELSQLLSILQEDEKKVRNAGWLTRLFRTLNPVRTDIDENQTKHILDGINIDVVDKGEIKRQTGFFAKIRNFIETVCCLRAPLRLFPIYVSHMVLTFEEELELLVGSQSDCVAVADDVENAFHDYAVRIYDDMFQTKQVAKVKLEFTVEKCDTPLRVVDTPGRGQCGYHALKLCGATDQEPQAIRDELLNSSELASLDECEVLTARLSSSFATVEGWCCDSILGLFALVHRITICIHQEDSCVVYSYGERKFHIQFRPGHYSAMVPTLPADCWIKDLPDGDELVPALVEFPDLHQLELNLFDQEKYSRSIRDEALKRAQDLVFNSYPDVICRSYYKMSELIERFDIPRKAVVVDVCGGPGGFAQCLLDHDCTVYGITKDEHIAYDARILDGRVNKFTLLVGPGESKGDIMIEQNLLAFTAKVVKDYPAGVNYVFCDGATEDTSDFESNADLVIQEVRLAQAVVSMDGEIFVKIVKPYAPPFVAFISWLVGFCDVQLIRLATSRKTSGECFLRLRNLRSLKEEFINNQVIDVGRVEIPKACRDVLSEFLEQHQTALQKAVDIADMLKMDRNVEIVNDTIIKDADAYRRILYRRPMLGAGSENDISGLGVDVPRSRIRCSICPRVSRFFYVFNDAVDGLSQQFLGDPHGLPLGYMPHRPVNNGPIVLGTEVEVEEPVSVETAAEVAPDAEEVVEAVEDPPDHKDYMVRNACDEYRSYLKKTYETETAVHKYYLNSIKRSPYIDDKGKVIDLSSLTALVHNYKGNYGLLVEGRFVIQPKDKAEKYNKVYTEDGFVSFGEVDKYQWAVVSDYTEVCLDNELYEALGTVDTSKAVMPKNIKFVQAAPGTGKTTYIVERCDLTNGDMVLLATTNGKEEFRSRVTAKHGSISDNILKSQVRTMQSVLLNHGYTAKDLYVDEALMHHSGAVFYAILLTNPESVYCLGDVHQIPFVNRTPDLALNYHNIIAGLPIAERLNVSYRCPADVVVRIAHKYDSSTSVLESANEVDVTRLANFSTCAIVKVTAAQDPAITQFKPTQLLTFTVEDKKSVAAAFKNIPVNTVHEFQGNQSARVAVVRLNANPQSEIFLRDAYALVALTRHTQQMVYFTRCEEDALSKYIKRPITSSDIKVRWKAKLGGLNPDSESLYVEDYQPVVVTPFASLDIVNTEFRNSNRFKINIAQRPSSAAKLNFVSPSINLKYLKGCFFDINKRLRGTGCTSIALNVDGLERLDMAAISRMVYPIIKAGVDVRFHSKSFIDNIHPKVFDVFNVNAMVPGYNYTEVRRYLNDDDFEQGVNARYFIVDQPPNGSVRVASCTYRRLDRYYFIFGELNAGKVKEIDSGFRERLYNSFREIKRVYVLPVVSLNDPVVDVRGYLETEDYNVDDVHVDTLQCVLNEVFPDCTFVDTSYDLWMMHNFDFEIDLPNMRIDLDSVYYKPSQFDTLKPVLKTVAPVIRQHTSREGILAAKKRNFDAPELSGTIDYDLTSTMMVECIKDNMVTVEFEPIDITPDDVWDWLKGQKTGVVDSISPEYSLENDALNNYNFEIKKHPKPDLTCEAHEQYKALQTIVSHPKHVNAIFCVVFREMKRRLMNSLKDNIKLMTDSSISDFCTLINDHCDMDGPGDYTEIDISKYDKSELELMLEFECKMMELLGVPQWLIQLWRDCHILTRVSDKKTGMAVNVYMQRKSGDASTLLGNCMYLLGCLLLYLSLHGIPWIWIWILGDDSVIKGEAIASRMDMQRFALMFNLEVKIFSYTHPYFCSKFLVKNSKDKYVLVPDPIKLLVKLARSDIKNEFHLEEYRISYLDNVKFYSDPVVCMNLSEAVSERYKVACDFSSYFSSMYHLGFPKNFRKLYYTLPGDRLDTTRCFSQD